MRDEVVQSLTSSGISSLFQSIGVEARWSYSSERVTRKPRGLDGSPISVQWSRMLEVQCQDVQSMCAFSNGEGTSSAETY